MPLLRFVGDVMMGRLVAEAAAGKGPLYPFEHVHRFLASSDILFGNLESPLTSCVTRSPDVPSGLALRCAPERAEALKAAGFSVLCLANNHILNFGESGLKETIAVLDRAGIRHVGAGFTKLEAEEPAILESKGMRVAFLAFTDSYPPGPGRPGCAQMDQDTAVCAVRKVRNSADIVVVSLHAGIDFVQYPTRQMIDVSRAAAAAGADIVVGHHPHQIHGIERPGGKVIAYSLGDFVFDHADVALRSAAYLRTAPNFIDDKPLPVSDTRTFESLILEVRVENKAITAVSTIPAKYGEDFQPSILRGPEADNILARLGSLSAQLENPGDPIWREMAELEMKVRCENLAATTFPEMVQALLHPKWRHFKAFPLYVRGKLLSFLRERRPAA